MPYIISVSGAVDGEKGTFSATLRYGSEAVATGKTGYVRDADARDATIELIRVLRRHLEAAERLATERWGDALVAEADRRDANCKGG